MVIANNSNADAILILDLRDDENNSKGFKCFDIKYHGENVVNGEEILSKMEIIEEI